MTKRWMVAPADPRAAESLASALSLPRPLAQVLLNRGYRDVESARRFLQPQLRQIGDPFALPDLVAAVDRILLAITRRQQIVIYGDYDVDGITATALLLCVLRAAGATVASFLPHRLNEGYGLSEAGLARCRREHAPELLVAVDCGTSSAAEIAGLTKQGIDTIVLDHHEPLASLPECVAVVNPKRVGQDGCPPVLWRELASVGVAFKLAHGLQKRAREQRLPWADQFDLRAHLDLVALGTVADIVSLTGENRVLVKAGLERLAQTDKAGLRALLEVAAVRGKVRPSHIGFRLGPRLNAAGRLGDAQLALELLLTATPDRARELAKMLHDHNATRQRIEERIVNEALAMVRAGPDLEREPVLVLAQEGWHVGVIGIVASRVVQEFYRPTVVIGIEQGVGKGSCRSIAGFSMVAALEHCAGALEHFGGHEMAAGLSIKPSQIAAFREALNAYARHHLSVGEMQPRLTIDAVVGLAELDDEFFVQLGGFEPCGPDNPTPVFALRGVRVLGAPRVVGQNHLKFVVTDGASNTEAIWWGHGDQTLPPGELEIAFVPELNNYRGVEGVQLQVRDVRAASTAQGSA